MTRTELDLVLKNHIEWLEGKEMSGRANLEGANLRGANLRGVFGDFIYIKTLQVEKYHISYTSSVLQIGCQSHIIEDWRHFSDEKISKMDNEALLWWRKWKEVILNIIKLSPCKED